MTSNWIQVKNFYLVFRIPTDLCAAKALEIWIPSLHIILMFDCRYWSSSNWCRFSIPHKQKTNLKKKKLMGKERLLSCCIWDSCRFSPTPKNKKSSFDSITVMITISNCSGKSVPKQALEIPHKIKKKEATYPYLIYVRIAKIWLFQWKVNGSFSGHFKRS